MSVAWPATGCRLARFGLVSANADGLAAFYVAAFGCRRIGQDRLDDAARITVVLGRERIEIVQFDRPGAPYPKEASASDLLFQHFALVVRDMAQAMARLSLTQGWSAITRGGPQTLPPSSGGVTAFKFRDPDGHPLEFLAFAPGKTPQKWQDAEGDPCLGIDHSAISVADTAISCRYYENLGLHIRGHSLNQGPEQERLDNLPDVAVDVTALSSNDDGPHIELLGYRGSRHTKPVALTRNAVAATCLTLECGPATHAVCRSTLDPDAHHLTIMGRNKTDRFAP